MRPVFSCDFEWIGKYGRKFRRCRCKGKVDAGEVVDKVAQHDVSVERQTRHMWAGSTDYRGLDHLLHFILPRLLYAHVSFPWWNIAVQSHICWFICTCFVIYCMAWIRQNYLYSCPSFCWRHDCQPRTLAWYRKLNTTTTSLTPWSYSKRITELGAHGLAQGLLKCVPFWGTSAFESDLIGVCLPTLLIVKQYSQAFHPRDSSWRYVFYGHHRTPNRETWSMRVYTSCTRNWPTARSSLVFER